MRYYLIVCFFLINFTLVIEKAVAQDENGSALANSSLRISGQLSGWQQYGPDLDKSLWFGARYMPQVNFEIPFPDGTLLDFEGAINVFGNWGIKPFKDTETDGKIKPYRLWGRCSKNDSEVRLGLQKVNFGSAQMFRPLMWFDKMDPRDPLQLTDGVWGGLFRHYFPNNANLWFWMLFGNSDTKGWEIVPTGGDDIKPEFGGRVQLPVPKGEAALSYHFRKALINDLIPGYDDVSENRFGFDVKLDVGAGVWLETSWMNYSKDLGIYTNQEMLTLGTDYTFNIGNGIGFTFEHLLYSTDKNAFEYKNTANFSGMTLSYPVSMIDDLDSIIYYDWKKSNMYFTVNWKKQFNSISFYLMGYWNPKTNTLPTQGGSDRFSGKGFQFMAVWNH